MTNGRAKGAAFEREVCAVLERDFGVPVKRVLGQARDGGADIHFGALRIECKRRKRFDTLYQWWGQVTRAATAPGDLPAMVVRADQKPALFVCRLDDVEDVATELLRLRVGLDWVGLD